MTGGTSAAVLRQFRTLYQAGTVAGLTDGQLLERFFGGRAEEAEVAFAAILARHGAMVLGVCRRALRDPNDVDDAFQATFLILVRKGRSVRVEDSLGRWLYGVSRKVTSRARAQSGRRRGLTLAAVADRPGPGGEAERRDLRALLDDELARLAEPFRSAVVLCDLGGLSLEEAARDLRCPVGTIKSRLARGRERLRIRLARQGFAPSAAILGAESSAPAALVEATVRGASRFASGRIEAGTVPASALGLAEGMLRTMTLIKLKFAAAALTCGLAATGAGVLAQQEEGQGAKATVGSKPVASARPSEDRSSAIARKLEEPVTFTCNELGLGRAVDELMKLTGLSIGIDQEALADLGLSQDSKVSITVDQVRLKTTLRFLLRPLNLAYEVVGEDLWITLPHLGGAVVEPGRDLATLKKRLLKMRSKPDGQDDPEITRAVKEIEEAEAVIARLLNAFAGIADPPPIRPNPGVVAPKPPDADPAGSNPPREFRKVSMPDYVIEPPDIIIIEAHQALPGRPITGERLVRPDGSVSLGFYGEIYVAGLTVKEVKAKVVEHLRRHVKDDALGLTEVDPDSGKIRAIAPGDSTRVFVDVTSYNSKVYYVQGDVAKPGRLPITGNETVLDAINNAGGLTATGSKANIRLIRPDASGSTTGERALPVDLDAIINRGDSKTNYQLFPGDRVVVYRDPQAEPAKAEAPAPAGDQEARLREVERKIDLILKKLDISAGGK